MEWGLLGGETIGGTRRTRTLGLAASVRLFNELAVPGLGGVWYAKQVVLALLGIHHAEAARRDGRGLSNITTANAVEALAVWWAFRRHRWVRDGRLPGYRKLLRHDQGQDPPFKVAASRSFYVSQPMRIRTRDALLTLGLVEAQSRSFNAYTCTARGQALLEAACPEARRTLSDWVAGGTLPFRFGATRDELDPTRPLPPRAREILREALVAGADPDRARRRCALDWVDALHARGVGHTRWDQRPTEIVEPVHWSDMRAGAAFGHVIAAAAGDFEGGSVLDRIEGRMARAGVRKLAIAQAVDTGLQPALSELRRRAQAFLALEHDPTPERAASRFCEECALTDDGALLTRLISRDERILRLADGLILAGAAFRGRPHGATAEPADPGEIEDEVGALAPTDPHAPLPEGISGRVHNLIVLANDFRPASTASIGA